jgi:hypothetical protein
MGLFLWLDWCGNGRVLFLGWIVSFGFFGFFRNKNLEKKINFGSSIGYISSMCGYLRA